jgi:hypothetical protein
VDAYLIRHVAGRHGAKYSRSGAPGVTSLNVDASDLFVPVLPLFEDPAKSGRAAAGAITGAAAAAAAEPTAAAGSMVAMAGLPTGAIASPLLSVGDINRFLTEQVRCEKNQLLFSQDFSLSYNVVVPSLSRQTIVVHHRLKNDLSKRAV